MKTSLKKWLVWGLIGLLVFTDSFLLSSVLLRQSQNQETARAGATIPVVPALFSTTLQASISTSDTSMTLTRGTDKSGDALNGTVCFILDEGTASEEFVCGTASSTSVTAMTRGLDPVDGDTEVAALKFAHRRGATVKVTDYPVIGILARILNGDETIPNTLKYATSTATSTIGSNSQNLVNVAYVSEVTVSGASNAAETVKGIVELGTAAECAAGTSAGGTGARLVCPTSLFSSTTSATTLIPVTGSDGKLSANWLPSIISTSHTFSASNTFSATSTFSGASIFSGAITFGAANTFSATTTFSGAVIGTVKKLALSSATTSLTNSTSETSIASTTIPAGTLSTSNGVRARLFITEYNTNTVNDTLTIKVNYGSTTLTTQVFDPVTAAPSAWAGQIEVTLIADGSTTAQQAFTRTILHLDSVAPDGTAGAATGATKMSTGVAAENSATDLVFNITATWNNGSTDNRLAVAGFTIEKIQ